MSSRLSHSQIQPQPRARRQSNPNVARTSSTATAPNIMTMSNRRRTGAGASFYLPSSSTGASPASTTHSRHASLSTTSIHHPHHISNHSSPSHSRRSSAANLALTLAHYRIPPPQPSSPSLENENETSADADAPDAIPGIIASTNANPDADADAGPETDPSIPEPRAASSMYPEFRFSPPAHRSNSPLVKLLPSVYKSNSSLALGNIGNDQFGQQRMDAVVEIHRVLYRGKEDLLLRGKILAWKQQGKAVRRVVERFFEDDCSYDHPLVQVSSRQNLISHFALLHLLSTGYVPAITPTSLYFHTKDFPVVSVLRGVVSSVRHQIHGALERERDVEAGQTDENGILIDKGKPLPLVDDKESIVKGPPSPTGLSETTEEEEMSEEQRIREARKWWKLWDISAECKEIGGMECYEGHHLAMLEHVVTLTLLPSLAKSRSPLQTSLSTVSSTESFSGLSGHVPSAGESIVPTADQTSFINKLVAVIATELDYFLNYDLPIQTIVHFNEVGKATQVRDYLDFRDCIETFIPFAKRLGWFTRRFNGYFSSSVGAFALSLVPKSKSKKKAAPVPLEKGKEPMDPDVLRASDSFIHSRRPLRPVRMGVDLSTAAAISRPTVSAAVASGTVTMASGVMAGPSSSQVSGNSLGLHGLGDAGPSSTRRA